MNLAGTDLKVLKESRGLAVLRVSLGCSATKVRKVELVRQDLQALKACWETKALKAMKDHQVGTSLSKEPCYTPVV